MIDKFTKMQPFSSVLRLAGLVVVAVLVAAVVLPDDCLAGGGESAEKPAADDGKAQASNPLVPYEVVDNIRSKAIPKPLTDKPGDPKRGEALMVNRKLGNCVACHHLTVFEEKAKTDPNKYGDMGEVGPTLDGVGARYDEGYIRLLIVDAKQIFPETIMPAFYRVEGFERVLPSFDDKPILSPQEVEDIVSFLKTLK